MESSKNSLSLALVLIFINEPMTKMGVTNRSVRIIRFKIIVFIICELIIFLVRALTDRLLINRDAALIIFRFLKTKWRLTSICSAPWRFAPQVHADKFIIKNRNLCSPCLPRFFLVRFDIYIETRSRRSRTGCPPSYWAGAPRLGNHHRDNIYTTLIIFQ
jgi:hypothetical protein